MNLVECYVIKVKSKPFESYGKWWVEVDYDCYGRVSNTQIMFDTEEEAKDVKKGFKFLS